MIIRQAEVSDIPALKALVQETLPSLPIPEFDLLTKAEYFCGVIADTTCNGYIFARIDRFNGERVIFIISAAAKKSVSRTDRIAAYTLLESWAHHYWVYKIVALTPTPEVFLKRWGFKLESFVISRQLTFSEHKT